MGNQQGKQRGQYGNRYIDWDNAERPSPPGKPYLSPDSADLPDIIKIRWAKPMTDGGAPLLGYLVEHRRTGSPHWLRASPNLAHNPELVLTGLEPGWRYQFRVTAVNDIGQSDPGELSEPLTVLLQRSAASAPHFNRELVDTIALENETVELTVHILATPAPKIAWYKDGFELFSSRRTKIVTENETSTLIIYQAALEDEGEIKCTATNRAGHAVTKGYLRLEAPPRIRLPRQYEEGLLFEKGEIIRLKVTSAGRPPPIVVWYHNGEQVLSGGRFDITDTDHGSALRVKDACRDDRGEYVVKGFNKIGEDLVSFLVTITDRPSSPGRPQVVMTLGRTVTLSWSCPDDDGGCKIGAYIVEYFRLGWDMWLKAATSRQLTTQLSELIEGSEYKFRVKAENPYGVSEPSDESDVIFIPDPKRGILKPEPRDSSDSWLSAPIEEDSKKKRSSSEQETDASKRRRLLEENARKLLDSPPSTKTAAEESKPETDSVKRRRLLDEKARKLLDTPIEDLLAEGSNRLNVIEKPARRRRDSRSPSVSPSLPDAQESLTPPVPKRRAKAKSNLSADVEPPSLTIPISVTRSPSPDPLSPALLRDDSITHGSSELMLVLYPEENKLRGMELSAQHRSQIELSFQEPAIAPPLSLSAPELGSDEPFEIPPLRNAVSSSELLHERAMARLYQDAAEEELHKNQMLKKSLERKPSLREVELERRSSLREAVVERRNSFKEAAEGKPEPIDDVEEHINRLKQTKQVDVSGSKIPVLSRKTQDPPKSILRKENRMNSVEREQLEFAKVRDRLRLKNENKGKEHELRVRPPNLKQESTMSSQLSSYGEEPSSEHYEAEGEDMSVEEEEEAIDEEEDYLEEESEMEIDEEDEEEEEEILKDQKFRPKSLVSSKPPAVPQHRYPKDEPEKIEMKLREAPKAVEEDTYHPRSMVPTSGVVRALPATIELEEPEREIPQITLNDEVEKPKKAEDNSTPIKKEEEKLSDSQIPILIQPRDSKKSKILKKIGFGRKEKKKTVAALIADSVAPVTSVVLPKPILKKKTIKKKEKDKSKDSQSPSPSRTNSIDQKKKQVRIAEPGEAGLAVPTSDDPKLSPITQARNQRLQRRQESLEEEEQANRILIYHYSDIVKEYGGPRKPPPKLYLNIEELEAHADDAVVSDEAPKEEEVAIVASDQEERGSAPDMSEVETDLGSILDIPEGVEESDVPEGRSAGEESLEPSRQPTPERTHSPSPTLSTSTPEEAVRSTMDYITDVAIFIFACWLYLFKNELYVIPVLVLLVYRQLHDTVKDKYTTVKQSVSSKIPESVRSKLFKEGGVDKDD